MLRDFGKEEFDIIILAGQSNSEGCGIGDSSAPYIPRDEVLYMNNDFSICLAQEYVCANSPLGNLSLSFCDKYIKDGRLENERKLLVIKAAVGGTGFSDHRWGIKDDLYIKMIDLVNAALELNPSNRLVAFLWHQGETDALLKAARYDHYHNLKDMITSFRDLYNCNDLPFIAGDFVHQWKNEFMNICQPVTDAIMDVCSGIGHARFVRTNGLNSNDYVLDNQDTIHFCREALNQLGLRYYDAYCSIINE